MLYDEKIDISKCKKCKFRKKSLIDYILFMPDDLAFKCINPERGTFINKKNIDEDRGWSYCSLERDPYFKVLNTCGPDAKFFTPKK